MVGLRTNPGRNHRSLNQDEEEQEEDIEKEDEEEEMSPVPVGKPGHPCVSLSDERGKRHCKRPRCLTPRHLTHQPDTVTHYTFK